VPVNQKQRESIGAGADILRKFIASVEMSIFGCANSDKTIASGELSSYLDGMRITEEYESKYFNIHTELKDFARTVPTVFLIDDLDRCLPDNVLKTLESIKLFLDIPGFAFVLAVDDDVVERGILYKYKDYGNADNLSSLITGSEYLEKIISLPFKIPHIGASDSRAFLWNTTQSFLRQ
jgi:hypothetical protein